MGLPLMSRYSSASTLGPLSIARPDPSKMRPSMSSDTPSFKLWPVNSTFVCRKLVSVLRLGHSLLLEVPHLLHIDAGGSLEDLIGIVRPVFSTRQTFSIYLDNGSVPCP